MNHDRWTGPVWRGLFLLGALLGVVDTSGAEAQMTELRYQDQDPDQATYISRILVQGDRLRMDYGQDEEDYILYDRRANAVWLIAHAERRVTEIPGGEVRSDIRTKDWPEGWRLELERQAKGAETLFQLRVNGQLCVEYRTAPLLKEEAALLAQFRRALAANQSASWRATPEELRQPCSLALDVREAGIEYRDGLPLALRYWDGRAQVYQGHARLPARAGLFEVPQDYSHFVVGGESQDGKNRARQPDASQAR